MTAATYQPAGYSTVSPYLFVSSADLTLKFLVDVLDAVELRRFLVPDGRIAHAEVRLGDSIIMLSDGGEGWPPVPAHIHVYVPDVDATYERALEAGATSVQEPVRKSDEQDKRAGVKDAGGTTWWIATSVA
jgi:uncharacterized glyoxalase superfamily protein PhnB